MEAFTTQSHTSKVAAGLFNNSLCNMSFFFRMTLMNTMNFIEVNLMIVHRMLTCTTHLADQLGSCDGFLIIMNLQADWQ